MELDKFKELLILSLKDNEIKKEIKSILSVSSTNADIECEKLTEQKKKYETMLNQRDQKIISLNKLSSQLKKSEESIKSDLDNLKLNISSLELDNKNLNIENKKLKDDLNTFTRKLQTKSNEFKDIKDVYKIYTQLPSNIKTELKGIFKQENIEVFIYCGVQYNNIESLWEYMKIRIANNQKELSTELYNIFEFFLNAYNKIYDKPVYKIQNVEIGKEFDNDLYIRGYKSKVNGKIISVELKGYINMNTNKIIKKSMVIV